MELISKELLSEVLEVNKSTEIKNIQKIGNIIEFEYHRKKGGYSLDGNTNIYELVHKCKEWALEGWEIHSAIIDSNKSFL